MFEAQRAAKRQKVKAAVATSVAQATHDTLAAVKDGENAQMLRYA